MSVDAKEDSNDFSSFLQRLEEKRKLQSLHANPAPATTTVSTNENVSPLSSSSSSSSSNGPTHGITHQSMSSAVSPSSTRARPKFVSFLMSKYKAVSTANGRASTATFPGDAGPAHESRRRNGKKKPEGGAGNTSSKGETKHSQGRQTTKPEACTTASAAPAVCRFSELNWHPDLDAYLVALAREPNWSSPYILLHGPSGAGSTTRARAFLAEWLDARSSSSSSPKQQQQQQPPSPSSTTFHLSQERVSAQVSVPSDSVSVHRNASDVSSDDTKHSGMRLKTVTFNKIRCNAGRAWTEIAPWLAGQDAPLVVAATLDALSNHTLRSLARLETTLPPPTIVAVPPTQPGVTVATETPRRRLPLSVLSTALPPSVGLTVAEKATTTTTATADREYAPVTQRLLIVHHIDRANIEAQMAFDAPAESRAASLRIVFTAESLDAVHAPLRSRCAVFAVSRPTFPQLAQSLTAHIDKRVLSSSSSSLRQLPAVASSTTTTDAKILQDAVARTLLSCNTRNAHVVGAVGGDIARQVLSARAKYTTSETDRAVIPRAPPSMTSEQAAHGILQRIALSSGKSAVRGLANVITAAVYSVRESPTMAKNDGKLSPPNNGGCGGGSDAVALFTPPTNSQDNGDATDSDSRRITTIASALDDALLQAEGLSPVAFLRELIQQVVADTTLTQRGRLAVLVECGRFDDALSQSAPGVRRSRPFATDEPRAALRWIVLRIIDLLSGHQQPEFPFASLLSSSSASPPFLSK